MVIVCEGTQTFTKNLWGQDTWRDFEFGKRFRKFIIYNNHRQIVAIGVCCGLSTPATYELKVGDRTSYMPHTGLRFALREHASRQQGMVHVEKKDVLVVKLSSVLQQ